MTVDEGIMSGVVRVAEECAAEAIKQNSTDCDGAHLLTRRPLGGDWDALVEECMGEPTAEERAIFLEIYMEKIRAYLEPD